MSKTKPQFSLVEAVDSLAQIADMEWETEGPPHEESIEKERFLEQLSDDMLWLIEEDPKYCHKRIKDLFRTILHHLEEYYEKDYSHQAEVAYIERMKNIMVIVGEAAKKLDKYSSLFLHTKKNSVTKTREYRELEEFYHKKIEHRIDEKTLAHWIADLTTKTHPPSSLIESQRLFVDLEGVKSDTDYELLLLKKEDGSRFLNPRLLRNITLVCDFGAEMKEIHRHDPFSPIAIWYDQLCHEAAKNILHSCGTLLDTFFNETAPFRHRRSIFLLDKAIISLMMSAHAENLAEKAPVKSCQNYFYDFQTTLRDLLHSPDYQRWITYPPQHEDPLRNVFLDAVHSFCRSLFLSLHAYQKWVPALKKMLNQAHEEWSQEHEERAIQKESLWSEIASDYAAMKRLMRYHPHGPLYKALEELEKAPYPQFDPLLQDNLPNVFYDIYLNEKRIVHVRMPSPIWQEWINQAHVVDEFRGFLRSFLSESLGGHHLFINMQETTTWKHHSRAEAIREFAHHEPFPKALTLVTFATETDFVKQRDPYNKENHADLFIRQLQEQLESTHCGYEFPDFIRDQLFPDFVGNVLEAIHRIFFSGKNVLSVEHRLQFIDIFHLFLLLKIIDIVQPTSFSCTCKDGIDLGPTLSTLLFAFLKLLQKSTLNTNEKECIDMMLYAAPILIRERLLLQPCFDRLVGALRAIEQAKEERGVEAFETLIREGFQLFFQTPIFDARLTP